VVTALPKVTAVKAAPDEHSNTESDLFNFLRQMHLTGGANGMTHHHLAQVSREGGLAGISGEQLSSLVVSRKRKAWEGLHSGGSKGGPGRREEEGGDKEEEEGGSGEEEPGRGWEEEQEVQHLQGRPSHHHLLSPLNTNFVHEEDDLDADNLAADFDGSFTGLGVDINTTNYSMSEAMLSLNTIAHHIKHADSPAPALAPTLALNPALANSYGALDLSNDEAQHPSQHEEGEETPPHPAHRLPPSFSGSVSRDNSLDSSRQVVKRESILRSTKEEAKSLSPDFTEALVPAQAGVITAREVAEAGARAGEEEEERGSRFQYILAAPTSIATKYGDPSLTYINQGQPYEIKIKKLGDLSGHYRKKWLRSTIRICFHERRLQYIESEQIAEWARTHPNERILEVDAPLSYGMADVKQEASGLNTISFLWDPTRDTGVFVKVHCISTEFTPKKHGGEKGVPFRLQVETWSHDDTRLHAASCILQVFKLKGADRKHKQDREKLSKRPDAEKDKFSPQYDCTMLTDLSVDSIYCPPSRGISPAQSDSEAPCPLPPPPPPLQPSPPKSASASLNSSREESPLGKPITPSPHTILPGPSSQGDSKVWRVLLPHTADPDTTAGWLAYNRSCSIAVDVEQLLETFPHPTRGVQVGFFSSSQGLRNFVKSSQARI